MKISKYLSLHFLSLTFCLVKQKSGWANSNTSSRNGWSNGISVNHCKQQCDIRLRLWEDLGTVATMASYYTPSAAFYCGCTKFYATISSLLACKPLYVCMYVCIWYWTCFRASRLLHVHCNNICLTNKSINSVHAY